MADTKISDMTAASALDGTELLAGVQSAANVKITAAQLNTYVVGAKARFKATKGGTNQTGIADATDTLLTWSTEGYDVGSLFASNVWTPPAGQVTLGLSIAGSGTISAFAFAYGMIKKNGTTVLGYTHPENIVLANAFEGLAMVADTANGTDTYSAYVYIDVTASTGTVDGGNANTYFWGQQI